MYHSNEDQERYPENYFLEKIDQSMTEDECFNLSTKPRQTQRSVGLFLKKIKGSDNSPTEETDKKECERKRFSVAPGSYDLEKEVQRNKGFWNGRPELVAPLTYQLKKRYSVDIKKKTSREPGIFYRPKYLELDHLKSMAKAGLLYPEEEFSDSEEEIEPDDSACVPLRKPRYKICDPCKEKKEKKEVELAPPKDLNEKLKREGIQSSFKKIPTGCQCDYYGEHNRPPTTWDNPFESKVDMMRQHEMNKILRPYKHELLSSYYEKHPPVKFMAHEPGMKRTFPVYQISNL